MHNEGLSQSGRSHLDELVNEHQHAVATITKNGGVKVEHTIPQGFHKTETGLIVPTNEKKHIKMEDALTQLGTFFSAVQENLGQSEDPFILYSTFALVLYDHLSGKVPAEQMIDCPGDIDVFTTEDGVRRMAKFLKEKGLAVDIEEPDNQIAPLTGSYDMKLSFNISLLGKPVEVEVFASVVKSPEGAISFKGFAQDLTENDVNKIPLNYKADDSEKEVTIPVFSPKGIYSIYQRVVAQEKHAEEQRNIAKRKNRDSSLKRAHGHSSHE